MSGSGRDIVTKVEPAQWVFELATILFVVPGPTTHTISRQEMEKLEKRSTPMTAGVVWPFPDPEIPFQREIKGPNLYVECGDVYPVRAVYLVDPSSSSEIVVHWAPYEKDRNSTYEYCGKGPEVFMGVVHVSDDTYRVGDSSSPPTPVKKRLPLKEIGEDGFFGQSDFEDAESDEEEQFEHRYEEQEEAYQYLPSVHRIYKKSFERLKRFWELADLAHDNTRANEDDYLRSPAMASIAIENMVVRYGRHGNYEKVDKIEIVDDTERMVRITWSN